MSDESKPLPISGAFSKAVPGCTYRHRKGMVYTVLHIGFMEGDLSPVVIYQGITGAVWVRPKAEFEDGRFVMVLEP